MTLNLLPKFSVMNAAAKEPSNKDTSLDIFFRHIETTANIASPAPTLSTTLSVKAGHLNVSF